MTFLSLYNIQWLIIEIIFSLYYCPGGNFLRFARRFQSIQAFTYVSRPGGVRFTTGSELNSDSQDPSRICKANITSRCNRRTASSRIHVCVFPPWLSPRNPLDNHRRSYELHTSFAKHVEDVPIGSLSNKDKQDREYQRRRWGWRRGYGLLDKPKGDEVSLLWGPTEVAWWREGWC